MDKLQQAFNIQAKMKQCQRVCQNMPSWNKTSKELMAGLKERAARDDKEILEVVVNVMSDPTCSAITQMWILASAAEMLEPTAVQETCKT